MTMGEFIKQLREERQLTQEELGKLLGVNRDAVSKWEKGRVENIKRTTIKKMAELFKVSPAELMCFEDLNPASKESAFKKKNIRVPVLGSIPAGIPIEAIEEIIDYEEMAYQPGEFFALVVNGDSMEPRIRKGDVVILRKQEDVDSGDVAAVMVNGFDATLKQVKKKGDLLILQSSNPKYEPMIFTKEEREEEPVRILGKLVELRGKY